MNLPPPTLPLQKQHGVDALIEILSHACEPITLATLGPLTNVAVALVKAPHLCQHLDKIVMMGGARGMGNITPSAEFNFFADPHAAQIVLASGIPITLIPLELTHQALATPSRQRAIRKLDNRVSQVVLQMLPRYGVAERGAAERERSAMAGPPLHDPCVIAYLLQPDLFSCCPAGVTIETASPLTLGRSIIDLYPPDSDPGNHGQSSQTPFPKIQVATKLDVDGFYQLLTESLAKF